MDRRRLGDIVLGRVIESEAPEFPADELIPDATPENLAPHRQWLEPHAIDAASGKLIVAVQTYVVRTRHHTLLIDTCVGNHKTIEWHPPWHMRSDERYLNGLAALGVAPESVDFVMCTHLHPDHVGWNTRLVDGRWVPTFPNASYVFARTEYEYWQTMLREAPEEWLVGNMDASVLPVVEAGQAEMVETDHALDDQVWLEPSPGHTPGHVSIRLSSKGVDAVMCGDLMHSPIQCAHPEWSSDVCVDKALSRRTRRGFLDRYCESGVLVLTAHFPSPSIGHIVPEGDAFRFAYRDWSA